MQMPPLVGMTSCIAIFDIGLTAQHQIRCLICMLLLVMPTKGGIYVLNIIWEIDEKRNKITAEKIRNKINERYN